MSIHKDVRIGHVHLTVANLERSLKFYRDILGFEVTMRYGESAVFLSAGGYHHHIGLNTWGLRTKSSGQGLKGKVSGQAGEGAPPAPPGHSGLYHFAILFPTRKELAKALKSLIDAKYPLTGASDHGVSEAIYLSDPDNIGIELYFDRPKNSWPRDGKGEIAMVTKPLDVENLLKEL